MHRGKESRVKVPVLKHLAHGAFLDLGRGEIQEMARRPFARLPVAGLDLQDRLAPCPRSCPQTPMADNSRTDAMASA